MFKKNKKPINVLKTTSKTNHPIKKAKKRQYDLDSVKKKNDDLFSKAIIHNDETLEKETDPFIDNTYICSKGKIYFFKKNIMTDTQVPNSFKFITNVNSNYCKKNFPLEERVVKNEESVNFGKKFRVRIAAVDNNQFVSGTMEWLDNEEEELDLDETEEFDLT